LPVIAQRLGSGAAAPQPGRTVLGVAIQAALDREEPRSLIPQQQQQEQQEVRREEEVPVGPAAAGGSASSGLTGAEEKQKEFEEGRARFLRNSGGAWLGEAIQVPGRIDQLRSWALGGEDSGLDKRLEGWKKTNPVGYCGSCGALRANPGGLTADGACRGGCPAPGAQRVGRPSQQLELQQEAEGEEGDGRERPTTPEHRPRCFFCGREGDGSRQPELFRCRTCRRSVCGEHWDWHQRRFHPRVVSHVEEEWGLFEVSRPATPGEVAAGSGEAPGGGATGGD